MGDFIEDSLKFLDEDPKQRKEPKENRKRFVKLAAVLAAAAVVLVMIFAPVRLQADISAYADTPITVSGLQDEDFTITPGELARMKLTKKTVTGKSAKAGTITAVGPTMNTFLKQYGKTVADFKEVKFYAADNYSVALLETFQQKTIILSLANGKETLKDTHQPLRVVVPGEDSSKWIRGVVKIVFIPND